MNILIVNQSVIDMCASFFTLLTAAVEVDGNEHVPMRPFATATVACRGGWRSQVTGQHPRSVSVPHLARETTSSPRPLYFYGKGTLGRSCVLTARMSKLAAVDIFNLVL